MEIKQNGIQPFGGKNYDELIFLRQSCSCYRCGLGHGLATAKAFAEAGSAVVLADI
jgi:hypothetical protein